MPAPNHPSPSGTSHAAPAVPGARERIVAAARRSFLAHGFSRFTMDELVRDLGMSKKTLYACFPTKEALVRTVLEAKVGDFRAGVAAIVESPELSFLEQAQRLVAHVTTQMSEVSPSFLRDLERQLPDLHARVQRVRREILPTVWIRMLTDGVRRGHVRGDLEIPVAAEMVLLAVEGLLQPAVLDRLDLKPRDAIRQVLAIMFAGMLTPAGREAYETHVSN